MAQFRQHIPTYVDHDPTPTFEFANTKELLALEVVQRYGREPAFSHFAMSGNNLMEISHDGFKWWVVGSVSDPSIVDLPKWEGWKFRARLADGSIALVGPEVTSSCGDVLTLRNGTKAKNLGLGVS